ncbi:hypothetical protein RRG08_052444 [Elysia crispata]|uniref:Uncharacterized protein n=1 Tax=Elysia crispata TaxID=231223 RepID=A0AAE1B284_9GAST|nr:hypothetical protein RRG08_052444 [Elysia crispata]
MVSRVTAVAFARSNIRESQDTLNDGVLAKEKQEYALLLLLQDKVQETVIGLSAPSARAKFVLRKLSLGFLSVQPVRGLQPLHLYPDSVADVAARDGRFVNGRRLVWWTASLGGVHGALASTVRLGAFPHQAGLS